MIQNVLRSAGSPRQVTQSVIASKVKAHTWMPLQKKPVYEYCLSTVTSKSLNNKWSLARRLETPRWDLTAFVNVIMEVMYLADDLSSSFEFIIKNFDRKRQTDGDGVSFFFIILLSWLKYPARFGLNLSLHNFLGWSCPLSGRIHLSWRALIIIRKSQHSNWKILILRKSFL